MTKEVADYMNMDFKSVLKLPAIEMFAMVLIIQAKARHIKLTTPKSING
jgi:hypothetical protein